MGKRATISFTDGDVVRLQHLKDGLDLSSNAQTLSIAIKIANDILEQQQSGGHVIFANGDEKREIIWQGLNRSSSVGKRSTTKKKEDVFGVG